MEHVPKMVALYEMIVLNCGCDYFINNVVNRTIILRFTYRLKLFWEYQRDQANLVLSINKFVYTFFY